MGSEHELFCLTDMDLSFASATDLVTFDKYLNLSLFCHKKNSFCVCEHAKLSINIVLIIIP